MKRIYTFLLLSLFVWGAAMAEVVSGTCGANGDNLTWTLDTETGALVISGEGAMANYEWDTSPWFSYKGNIVSVEITDGVTTIGGSAFRDCFGLTSLTIPNSVTTIGDWAFYDCFGLTSLTIPNSVTEIGDRAFSDCSGLTSLTIPNSVTTIGDGAFSDCSGLTSLTIPNSVTEIGNYAFSDCSGLTSISVAADNPYYDSRNDCNAIIETASNTLVAGCKNTVIPNSVITIGDWAFYYCRGLTSLTIPNSVTTIGHRAFSDCSGLTSISVAADNPYYDSRNDCNAIIETASNTLVAGCKNTEIPNSVTTIGGYAFYGCSGLTSLTIPNSVTTIGDWAFFDCFGLTSLTIPNSVTTIGSSAFYDCDGLTSLTIPNSVMKIGDYAFERCSGLTSLTMKSATPPSTGSDVFYNCNALTTIYVPVGAAVNYDEAPWNSYNIVEVSTKVQVDNLWYNLDFENQTAEVTNSGTTGEYSGSIVIPGSISAYGETFVVTAIGQSAFSSCSGLTSLTIPNSVTTIEFGAFAFCSGLTSISVVGDNPYYDSRNDCNAIIETASNTLVAGCKNTEIPNSVTTIGGGAFGGCSGLTSLAIPNSVTTIGQSAFNGCSGLTSITIPNSVTTIGDFAFYGCSGLTSLTIPNSVTTIRDHAFQYCSGLTNFTIPNSVTRIGNYVFYDCSGLTSITMEPTTPPTSKESDVFYNCDALTTIYVPFGAAANYDVAPWNSYNIVEMSTKVQVDNLWYNLDFENQTAEVTNSSTIGEYSGSIVIPGSISAYGETFVVTAIGESAFSSCFGLTSITIPNSVTTIGGGTFFCCFGLTSITIPNSVTTIGEAVFYGCSGLTSLTIPNSVTEIGNYAFSDCSGLTSISVAGDNPYYDSRNDCNAIIETASNTLVAGCKNTEIPNSVTTIGGRAFNGCSGLTSLTIPNTITKIEHGAFSGCSGLMSISVAADNPYYDSRNDCNAIIETASNTLVAGCKNTEIPNSVTTIGESAFEGCSGLMSLTIPNSVTTIGGLAFWNCFGLTSLTIPNSVTTIGESAFYGCSGLMSLTISNSVTTIGRGAFWNCYGLTSLTIPNSVTTIGESAFSNCYGLTSLTMKSATPPSTGSDVFSYCDALTTIYVPVGAAANYDLAPWNNYNIIGETLGVVSSNPATGEEVEGLSVITLTFNKEIKSINESLIKLTATSSSTQVPVSVQINATNTKALTITLSQAVYNGDTYVLTLAAGAVAAMDDKSNEEALEMSYVVTTKPLEDVDLSKLYRIKDVETGLYLNAANYDVHEEGTHGGVNAIGKANSDDQVFTISKEGNNFKLQTASGKYIYCQGWNVDALDEGTALTFVPVEEGAFYIMRGSQYFKIEQVGSVYYPFCDAPESKRAKFVLEEVVRVALTDGEDYTQAAEMEAERITYTRNFKNTYYQPWYVPFDVEYDEIIDRFVVAELNDIHQFDDNNDGEFERWAIEVLQLKRGDVISANHPYMIKARTAGEQSIVVENTTLYPATLNTIDCSSTKMLYTFEPTYTTLSGSVLREEGCYVVGSGKLVKPTDGSVVKANRWYLRPEPRNGGSLLSAPKQIQIFERDENGLTDIETAIEESEQTTWPADVYDLNGRLVRKAATNMDGLNKGMYIVNGKKIVK